jgi:hypothetical protein
VTGSNVAQWERTGLITQGSVDRNHPLLYLLSIFHFIFLFSCFLPPTHTHLFPFFQFFIMGKKQFIDKKKARHFQLVHRSQRDPLILDAEVPDRVFVEVKPVSYLHSKFNDP